MDGRTDGARGRVYDLEGTRLEPAERRMVRDGTVVPLTPKAFDVLVYLVERAGTLVDKATLMSAVWPGTFVEEANLAFQVFSLRKVLDQGRGTSMIQTIPTRGYRFVGAVKVEDPGPPLAPGEPPIMTVVMERPQEPRTAVALAAAFAGIAAVVLVASLYDAAERPRR